MNDENREPDDVFHNPDPRHDRKIGGRGTIFTVRGLGNLGFLVFLAIGCLMLLCVFRHRHNQSFQRAYSALPQRRYADLTFLIQKDAHTPKDSLSSHIFWNRSRLIKVASIWVA